MNNHHKQNIAFNADQVEYRAFKETASSIKYGTADERIADALDDFSIEHLGEFERWADEDIRLDNAEGETLEEIERRISLLGELYPFRLAGAALEYAPPSNNSQLYEALLCITQADNLTTGKYRYLPRYFEFLACIVSEIYLGNDALSHRTGWPRGQGEPKKIKDLVDKIRQLSGEMVGEWKWNPREGLPDNPSHKDVKDCGIDVVAWKQSIDKRTGQLYILGQCACGKDWIDVEKLSEIKNKNITDWIEQFPIQPVNAFFTPYNAADDSVLFASRKAGIFFDRARILLYAASSEKIYSDNTKSIIVKIIDTVSKGLD